MEGCKSLVGLDSCQLKGKFGGHILSAITRDGNENIFLVALGVIEQENKDSWVWFLQTFADDIGRPDELNLVFISDRQKVIHLFFLFLDSCFLRLSLHFCFLKVLFLFLGRWCSSLFFGCFLIVFMITKD